MGILSLQSWWSNFIQWEWLEITPKKIAVIDNPYAEYTIYWLLKNSQISAVVGGLIVHPVYRWHLNKKLTSETTTNNSKKIIRNTCRRIQGRFLITALLLAPFTAFSSIWINGYTRADVENRCYEIRLDYDGLLIDRYTLAIGMIGWFWRRFQGMADGINFALLYSVYYIKVQRPYTNILLAGKPIEPFSTLDEALKNSKTLYKFFAQKDKESKKTIDPLEIK